MAELARATPVAFEELVGPRGDDAAREVERTIRFLLQRSYPGNALVRERADDIVQDVLTAAVKQAGRIAQGAPPLENPDAWLCRVTLNAARRLWRREGGVRAGQPLEAVAEPAVPPLASETRLALRRALARLDAACRKLLIERDVLGHARDALAAALGITSNALGVRLHRCRRKLLDLVEGAEAATAH